MWRWQQLTDDFVGRSEELSKRILGKLLNCEYIQGQVPLEKVIRKEDYDVLDQELKNHKFDFIIKRKKKKDIAVEVNFKHGDKAARKWSRIFIPLLEKADVIPLAINDYNCDYLFKENSKKEHKNSWGDFKDVMSELQEADIEPDIE